MSAHVQWTMVDREGDVIMIGTGNPDDPAKAWVRIRLDAGAMWAEKDFTPEAARSVWWALGQVCDFAEAQQEESQ